MELMLGTILGIMLVLMLLATQPIWQHSRQPGYYLAGGLEAVLGLMIILLFSSKL
jgi:hypothetical protein